MSRLNFDAREGWREITDAAERRGLFTGFTVSAFRLELLQAYGSEVETDAYRSFASAEFMRPWCELVSEHSARGRRMDRVHVVDLPLSPYVRFEISCAYVHSSRAGENILLVDRTALDDDLRRRLSHDFWLFDDRTVLVQKYDELGALETSLLNADDAVVKDFQELGQKLSSKGIPFRTFFRSVNGEELE